MSEEKYVTVKDVAAAAKVGIATASRALRDDPSTAAKTREHVKKVAAELGYRPDPGMSRMAERRWHGKHSQSSFNLGYLYDSKSTLADTLEGEYKRYKKAADAQGYTLITEDISEFKTLKSLTNRLSAQGIKGLLLPLLPNVPFDLTPILQKYAAVSLNVSEYSPQCPVVMHDEFSGITQVWKTLNQRGYKRIGMILPDFPESPSTNLRLGAILVCQKHTAAANRVPEFSLKDGEGLNYKKFTAWMKKHKPDVLLGYTNERVIELTNNGLRIPEDIPFVASNLWNPNERGNIAGLFRDNLELFDQAIHLLNTMIRSGSVGTTHASLVEQVKGTWLEGKSLPEK